MVRLAGSVKPDANMQPRNKHTQTHTLNLPFPFTTGGDPQLTGGPCLELEPTNPEAEAKDYSGKGKGGEGRSNRKNITTKRKLDRLTIWYSSGLN